MITLETSTAHTAIPDSSSYHTHLNHAVIKWDFGENMAKALISVHIVAYTDLIIRICPVEETLVSCGAILFFILIAYVSTETCLCNFDPTFM